MGCAAEAIQPVLEADRSSECFAKMFAIEIVNSEAQRREAFRLRYRVYCEEHAFERPENFPEQLEWDEFDGSACHAIVRHRQTGVPVGVVRLILRDSDRSQHALPVEQVCGGLFDRSQTAKFSFRKNSIAEVSRFAVSKTAVAEVMGNTSSGRASGVAADNPQCIAAGNPFQNIVLGLIAALFQMSASHGVDHWYALMEPALARHLSRMGLRFTRVGPLVNHHGKRQPMMASLAQLRKDIASQNPVLHELIAIDEEPVVQRIRRIVHLGWPDRMLPRNLLIPACDLTAEPA